MPISLLIGDAMGFSKYITTLLFGVLLTATSCNPLGEDKSELKIFEVQSQDFGHVINDKALPEEPNLNLDKTILNRDYPIEIALYNDGRWYYDLPNLDTGVGTWKYENGKLKLFAQRERFDMYIDVVATQESAKTMAIKFIDRFGPKSLTVEKINQP
tara:strand:+ start:70838 stop:71308 length:471 start_codon:yes stop_codon:yes gene_type:complete